MSAGVITALSETHRSVVAHLAEDQVLPVQLRDGSIRELQCSRSWMRWLHLFDDEDGVRPAWYTHRDILVRNLPPEDRQVVQHATHYLAAGQAALIVWDRRHRTTAEFGRPYGVPVWRPVGFELVPATDQLLITDDLATQKKNDI